ncbi:hypothetical protein CKM354_000266900 [Cercospora kikuchii]|uniref:Lipocalin-like domain-containing protein n=1 Tax=Cercospora kikuchii TaxID=84275 RepID=A0A9P3CG37_9PEZI|nr:uncharacterized protein CKM354_000266900 [Cercospora kikuchii]GIZ39280.1 hypothetical protein CKM354_000266900 [Cercospora kikuchii]
MSSDSKVQAIVRALAGTYALINSTATLNGVSVPDLAFGEDPVGLLTYTPSGFMSLNIAATQSQYRPANLTFPYNETDSNQDWALVGQHTLSYAGPWSVSHDDSTTEKSGSLVHGPIWVANVPKWTGIEEHSNYSVHETKSSEGFPKGTKLLRMESKWDNGNQGVLWWRRVDGGTDENDNWIPNSLINGSPLKEADEGK